GGKQVLGRGDEYALAQQAGGVADFGYVAAVGGNLKIVEIGAVEHDPRASGSRQQAHRDRCPGMEAHPRELQGCCDSLFQTGGWRQKTTPVGSSLNASPD